ncbi:MAG: hypothetical protein US62_C0023G0007 [Candidatus Woesebacteria bacterium GW2011_GWA1_37_8]|uniref:Uncharacterized protein n=2 Tax=Candidatus Woeseibacteriota TaxID=1752722 RepID=A0A0G0NMN8_9BACT|nr:MAG: hypothetical protein US39_C0003G0017 [Microgenomates group bacterium GW2011_GWC1_37_12b]KKQ44621.1 MAG: hypothetical protein US62_C0023G0007 [Candidatus Woesebacteria bacterium GW2011_GWA1_37_8]KKQ87144.1 MAG: hypothetical protein UT10_C0010G0019 [Candidatus Woesebacteria bacterium GW2011_GWB1_38_8b]
MKIDRFRLGPNCDDPVFCFLTGTCYCAWLLDIDTQLVKKGVPQYAEDHLERLDCESIPGRQARTSARFLVSRCGGIKP